MNKVLMKNIKQGFLGCCRTIGLHEFHNVLEYFLGEPISLNVKFLGWTLPSTPYVWSKTCMLSNVLNDMEYQFLAHLEG